MIREVYDKLNTLGLSKDNLYKCYSRYTIRGELEHNVGRVEPWLNVPILDCLNSPLHAIFSVTSHGLESNQTY